MSNKEKREVLGIYAAVITISVVPAMIAAFVSMSWVAV